MPATACFLEAFMSIFLTADTHFGHGAVMRYCSRPFASTEEMDTALFANWRACIGPQDTVYHLGDVLFGNREQAARLGERIRRLPGRKLLVPGNHDWRHMALLEAVFDEVIPPLADVRLPVPAGTEGFWNGWATICHYPMSVWNGFYRGSVHFHGHVHARMLDTDRRIDVGVDNWDYAPARLEAVLARMRAAMPYESPEIEPAPEGEEEDEEKSDPVL
ncbi:MAG: metallophosphoesterase [Desulfovibrio sp.]|nr:metallophosphoesterase [Desulfovibrio sp.]